MSSKCTLIGNSLLMLFSVVAYADNTPRNGVFSVGENKQVYFSNTLLHNEPFPEQVEDGWRLLAADEWAYLLAKGDDEEGEYFGRATVGTEQGLMLLPDNWWSKSELPDFRPGDDTQWSTNSYTYQWEEMEAAGAVFLPAAGRTQSDEPQGVNEWGYYWAASDEGNSYFYFSVNSTGINQVPSDQVPSIKCSLILVKDKQDSPTGLYEGTMYDVPCTKVIENGVLYLKYKGTMYDVRGGKVERQK